MSKVDWTASITVTTSQGAVTHLVPFVLHGDYAEALEPELVLPSIDDEFLRAHDIDPADVRDISVYPTPEDA